MYKGVCNLSVEMIMRITRLQYRIFKTLRFDENSFVPVFFRSLLNTTQFRPYLRPDSRLPFTTRLENGKYVVKKTVDNTTFKCVFIVKKTSR